MAIPNGASNRERQELGIGSWELTFLHQQVRRTLRRHGLCPPGSRLCVGVSGGSDSVALTLILREVAGALDFSIVTLAHLNHRLRPTADRDAQFCHEFAARLGLPLATDTVDVQAYAASERLSVENAARQARYAFLHRAAADAAADRIAVGHTRDDQAETVLLKLIRGAGLAGLGGIYPQRGVVIRPLLDVARADLRAFLASSGQTWVEDESNESLNNPRNRIRHRVLPELDTAYGGPTRPGIARAASLAREDGQWLDDVADRRFEAIAITQPNGLELDGSLLAAEPAPIRRRIMLKAMRTLAGRREVGLEHVEAALEVLSGTSGAVDVPGSRLELRRGKVVLLNRALEGDLIDRSEDPRLPAK
jgi:tRNA(Ile)-lysidine synthase